MCQSAMKILIFLAPFVVVKVVSGNKAMEQPTGSETDSAGDTLILLLRNESGNILAFPPMSLSAYAKAISPEDESGFKRRLTRQIAIRRRSDGHGGHVYYAFVPHPFDIAYENFFKRVLLPMSYMPHQFVRHFMQPRVKSFHKSDVVLQHHFHQTPYHSYGGGWSKAQKAPLAYETHEIVKHHGGTKHIHHLHGSHSHHLTVPLLQSPHYGVGGVAHDIGARGLRKKPSSIGDVLAAAESATPLPVVTSPRLPFRTGASLEGTLAAADVVEYLKRYEQQLIDAIKLIFTVMPNVQTAAREALLLSSATDVVSDGTAALILH